MSALAQELPAGLAAVALNPGIIDTRMLRSCFGEGAGSYPTPEQWARWPCPIWHPSAAPQRHGAHSSGHVMHTINSGNYTESQLRDWRWAWVSFSSLMPEKRMRDCWRRDLSDFRGLTVAERSVYPLVLEWFDNFRARCGLEAGRDAIEAFWREEVVPAERPRESWQLEQWKNAIQWYLNWLDACAVDHAENRTLPEWVLAAAQSAGTRRGLSPNTIRSYKAWAKRYAAFAGSEREMRRMETANRFLASVVDNGPSAYPTRKQALNAMTFFFKHVWGSENPVFDVKLKKPNRA